MAVHQDQGDHLWLALIKKSGSRGKGLSFAKTQIPTPNSATRPKTKALRCSNSNVSYSGRQEKLGREKVLNKGKFGLGAKKYGWSLMTSLRFTSGPGTVFPESTITPTEMRR